MRSNPRLRPLAVVVLGLLMVGPPAAAAPEGPRSGPFVEHGAGVQGRVVDDLGEPIAGAMLTLRSGLPFHELTVFSDADGRFAMPPLLTPEPARLRARRVGFADSYLHSVAADAPVEIVAKRITRRSVVAHQLPAHHWYRLVLDRVPDDATRHQLKRECTYCHQQGSVVTRRARSEEEWTKILGLMGRRGAMLPAKLRGDLPALFRAAYDPDTSIEALTPGWPALDFAPPAAPAVRRAVIEEWSLGSRDAMQHDVLVHPDGRIYSVDGAQDRLYRLDPEAPDGDRRSWQVPSQGRPVGGIFGNQSRPVSQVSNAHVSPHSLQTAPDGSVWITLASGNMLARFDPETETMEVHEVADGFYPHTLRFDQQGRFWYTMAASNHVGRFDPATNEQVHVRLPARTMAQAVALRLMPFFLWLDQRVDLRGSAAESGDGFNMPVPYGIDIAEDGGVWFSQLNEDRIGRIDPETLEVTIVETPFPAPRRLRFDSQGRLWIPSFSAGLLAVFDPADGSFESWPLPIEPHIGATPYALHVDRRTDQVWVCGTNSDTLIRFDPAIERWWIYPLPTRGTFTRELDFDDQGRVWTSNSSAPAWHIEDGQPRVLRLDPAGAPPPLPFVPSTAQLE
jgi:streptogramin lyase